MYFCNQAMQPIGGIPMRAISTTAMIDLADVVVSQTAVPLAAPVLWIAGLLPGLIGASTRTRARALPREAANKVARARISGMAHGGIDGVAVTEVTVMAGITLSEE